MKIFLAITITILTFTLFSAAQTKCDRYVATAGGFSICPPAGWTVQDDKDQNYKIMTGPAGPVFAANLNFKDDPSAAPMKAYVDGSGKYILDVFNKPGNAVGVTSIKLTSQTEFVTDQKESGYKVIFLAEARGVLINSNQYYFQSGAKKVVATFTGLESERPSDEKIFDGAAKTFFVIR